MAFIEKCAVSILIRCSDDALRAYITLAKFANRFRGHAYPSNRLLLRHLGFAPYYTSWLTGVTQVWKLKDERRNGRRKAQINKAVFRLNSALLELQHTCLIDAAVRRNAAGHYRIFRLLDSHGYPRKLRFDGSAPFFMIGPDVFAVGAFAMWKRRHDGIFPLSGTELRTLLLALRDNDDGRFGGIDPSLVHFAQNRLICRDWPSELQVTQEDCVTAIESLLSRSILRRRSVVLSTYDGHLITSKRPAAAADEMDCNILRVGLSVC